MKDIVSLDGFLNESTYSDFLSHHGKDVSEHLYQLKQFGRYFDKHDDENTYVIAVKAAYKACSPYDKNVVESIERWMTDRGVTADDVARVAVENQNRHGTETSQVVHAMADFVRALSRETGVPLKESAGFNPSTPLDPTTRQSDRKRVTAVLAFAKALFQAESQNILSQLKGLGAVEFQRISGAANPNVEMHVDFPTIHKLDEFRSMQPQALIESLELASLTEGYDVHGFSLRDEDNIEKADKALRAARVRHDSDEGPRGEMIYSFFDKAQREKGLDAVRDAIDFGKEKKGWDAPKGKKPHEDSDDLNEEE